MAIERIGCGLGQKSFESANCLRAIWGMMRKRSDDPITDDYDDYIDTDGIDRCSESFSRNSKQYDTVSELVCQIDDMTGEELGFALDMLLENGSLVVFCQPIMMKKQRPGVMLVCLCRSDDEERFIESIFRLTTTLGVRVRSSKRAVLQRRKDVQTLSKFNIRRKRAQGWGGERDKIEYEDAARYARIHKVSLREARHRIQSALETANDT